MEQEANFSIILQFLDKEAYKAELQMKTANLESSALKGF